MFHDSCGDKFLDTLGVMAVNKKFLGTGLNKVGDINNNIRMSYCVNSTNYKLREIALLMLSGLLLLAKFSF